MNISFALKMGMGKAALAPGNISDPLVTEILDSIDMKQYLYVEIPKKIRAVRGKMIFNMLPMVKSVLEAYLRPDHILQNYQSALPQENQRLETFSGDGLSLQAQAIKLSELLQFFYGDYGIPMILAAQIAQKRIKNLFKQEAAQVRDHLVNLGVALPGNKTTEMGELMYALASSDEIGCYESASDFVADLEEKKLASEFLQIWNYFMAEFGIPPWPGPSCASSARGRTS